MDSADRMNEKCAVVGVFNAKNSALLCYYSLFAMQHRGQESSGISTTDGHKITTIKGEGLVTAVFSEGLDKLQGNASIGHNRYSTAGDDSKCDTQPIFAKYSLGEIALAHNGNLVNAKEVRDELITQGAIFQSHLDTENLIHLIARSKKARLRDRIIEGLQKIKGAYSFVLLSRGKLFAMRDPWGFRPLSLGEITNDDGSKGFVVASESCAFDLIGAKFVRDVEPGEMLIFSLDSARGNSPLDLHFADLADFGHCADSSLALRPKSAKNHESQTENPSVVDSALAQNLGENSDKIAESSLDSAESQNLNQNNSAQSAHLESRPLRGAKNREQGCSSATADFLLEAEKRGSPPKSEKRQLLGTHLNNSRGEREQGGAALLRKESSENNGEGGAESSLDSTDSQNLDKFGLPYLNAQFESIQVFPPTPKHCIFEFVYFARPDSVVFNKSVYEIRKNMGVQLAREYKIKADFVIPVPDSGVISALGYAQESGIPFEFGIVRNHYIGRTFIEPTQKSRELKVKLKLNPISRLLQGREIIVIDDSVVRGTTSKQIISILRKSGAKKVHLVIASPQTIAPCYYGVDTPDSADLICANKNIDEVREFIGADSLHFLSLSGLYKSIGIENGEHYCKACFDGEYVI